MGKLRRPGVDFRASVTDWTQVLPQGNGGILPDSASFEWVSAALESATSLSRLEARGTVRLALRSAGLDVGFATREQTLVLLKRVLPRELGVRGIANAEEICQELAHALGAAELLEPDSSDSPEDTFRRLGGS